MPASYPNSIVTLASHADNTDTIFAADINTPNAEIVAVETGLLNGFQHDLVPLNATGKSVGSTAKRWLKVWCQDLDLSGTLTIGSGLTVPSGGTGAATLAAHGVLIGQGTSAVAATAVGTTGQVLTGVTGADPTFQAIPATAVTRLTANSGTSTAAGATNVDTIAISGLTINDRLEVEIDALSSSQATANIGLYNLTDGVPLNTSVASLAAGATLVVTGKITQSQASATSIVTKLEGKDTVPTVYNSIVIAAATTPWTGSWTLAFRHGGVAGGGTLQWKWIVKKLAGQ